jgi:hypothetical protein
VTPTQAGFGAGFGAAFSGVATASSASNSSHPVSMALMFDNGRVPRRREVDVHEHERHHQECGEEVCISATASSVRPERPMSRTIR